MGVQSTNFYKLWLCTQMTSNWSLKLIILCPWVTTWFDTMENEKIVNNFNKRQSIPCVHFLFGYKKSFILYCFFLSSYFSPHTSNGHHPTKNKCKPSITNLQTTQKNTLSIYFLRLQIYDFHKANNQRILYLFKLYIRNGVEGKFSVEIIIRLYSIYVK